MIKRIHKFVIFVCLFLAVSSAAEAYSLIDWFYDKNPPMISTGFDNTKTYKGEISIHFLVADRETAVDKISIFLDDKDITSSADFKARYFKNRIDLDTRKLLDGTHNMTIMASDKARDRNLVKMKISFTVDNTPPTLRFVRNSRLYYGKTTVLYFRGSEPDLDIKGSFQGKEVECYPTDGRDYALTLGSELSDPPDKGYILRLSAKDKAGNFTNREVYVKVYPSRYPVVRFRLRPRKAHLLSPEIIRADWDRAQEILIGKRPEKFLVGRFILPAKGVISLPFGTLEYINGKMRGRHRGIDIANVKGTQIKASNSGEVVLAEYLPAHGNTVIIDHGRGIFSFYAHLHEFKTEVGQRVWKGQVIGTMGSTGISTAPHVHFSVSVHDTRVDPVQWVNSTMVE